MVGGYHFVHHGNDISDPIKETVYIQLNKDGTISGAVDGTWKITDDYYATLTINEEVAGKIVPVEYNGVFLKQWDESQSTYVMAFIALSNNNMTILGSQLEEIETEELIKADEELKIEEQQEQSEVEMEIFEEIESIEEAKEALEESKESEVEEVTPDLTVGLVVISSRNT